VDSLREKLLYISTLDLNRSASASVSESVLATSLNHLIRSLGGDSTYDYSAEIFYATIRFR
jgi:hypothetical protein